MKCEAICKVLPSSYTATSLGIKKAERCRNEAAWHVSLQTPDGIKVANLCYSHAAWATEIAAAVGEDITPQKIDDTDGVRSW